MAYQRYEPGFRKLVVGTDTKVPVKNGGVVTYINFDNAATTPPLVPVIQEIINFAPWYSSVHRGAGYKSQMSTDVFENSRGVVLDFLGADAEIYTAIFVKNATEAINKLACRLCNGSNRCVVLSTDMEHHSNDLPWRKKFLVDYITVDDCGRLSLDDLEYKLAKYQGDVKLVTVSGASNVTGYVNPYHEIAALSHKYGARIIVDGAQLVPHRPVCVSSPKVDETIDYIVFSAHKMYAPFGIGVLVGLKETFERGDPDYVGGGTVKVVTHDYIKWEDPPGREEAGTPNLMGIVALDAAIGTLKTLGMENIENYEAGLTEYTLKKLKNISDIELYEDYGISAERVGIIPFNIKGMYHGITSLILSYEGGIAVRSGCFCAQPYIQKLLNIDKKEISQFINSPGKQRPGMVRISFGMYNTYDEVDRMIYLLDKIVRNKESYIKKYEKFI